MKLCDFMISWASFRHKYVPDVCLEHQISEKSLQIKLESVGFEPLTLILAVLHSKKWHFQDQISLDHVGPRTWMEPRLKLALNYQLSIR